MFTAEMAKGKKESTNDVFIGCTLTPNDYYFLIDLMPVSIKSFDVIISIDWLSLHCADILCYEKAICLNLPNSEALGIYVDKLNMNLRIISCIKAQKIFAKGVSHNPRSCS